MWIFIDSMIIEDIISKESVNYYELPHHYITRNCEDDFWF